MGWPDLKDLGSLSFLILHDWYGIGQKTLVTDLERVDGVIYPRSRRSLNPVT